MASARSAGKTVPIGGEQVTVVELADGEPRRLRHRDLLCRRRNLCRMGAEVRRGGRDRRRQLLATGACTTTMPLVVAGGQPCRARRGSSEPGSSGSSPTRTARRCRWSCRCKALHEAAALQRIVVTTMQSVSGTGKAAIDELRAETAAIVNDQNPPAPHSYPHQIAFNVISAAGSFTDGERLHRRRDQADQRDTQDHVAARILRSTRPAPACRSTSVTANRSTSRPSCRSVADQARELLEAQPGVRVVDDPAIDDRTDADRRRGRRRRPRRPNPRGRVRVRTP